jgi:hypothetical protein
MGTNPSLNRPRPPGAGCLALFGLPFAGFGVFALVMSVREAQVNKLKQAGMLAIFGLVFSSVGFGLITAAIYGRRTLTLFG